MLSRILLDALAKNAIPVKAAMWVGEHNNEDDRVSWRLWLVRSGNLTRAEFGRKVAEASIEADVAAEISVRNMEPDDPAVIELKIPPPRPDRPFRRIEYKTLGNTMVYEGLIVYLEPTPVH